MSAELHLCISQDEINRPYKFTMTNINVYSMEEAAYHCYHYWKQSYDEFLLPEFLDWVRDVLNQHFFASQIIAIKEKSTISERLLSFLSLFDYFDQIQLAKLKSLLIQWEKRLEWERLKEQGDYLTENGNPDKAIPLYKKALTYGENLDIYNNLSISLMELSYFQEAIVYLEKALNIDNKNINILLNLAEACIYNHNFEKALRVLSSAEEINKSHPDIQYLYGELNFETGNIRYSIEYFKKAISINKDSHYISRLTDVYVKLRQYDNALENLENMPEKNKNYYLKKAAVFIINNNVPAAIRSIQQALLAYKEDVELWTKLAEYHRLDYDLKKADSAITKAISISANDDKAKLEQAKIKKAQGKVKEYQSVLGSILNRLKNRYRDTIC